MSEKPIKVEKPSFDLYSEVFTNNTIQALRISRQIRQESLKRLKVLSENIE